MGYRLSVEIKGKGIDVEPNFYGTEYYGYVGDMGYELMEISESYRYLVKIGKADRYNLFYDCSENYMELTADQFSEFIKLYAKDYEGREERNLLDDTNIKKLLESNEDKVLRWF